ncbi:GLE1-like protein-domain-containing protein [Phakopsora pachyrhizi]|nr:GLE1-like protein-domain-containing protein [Phakopsora pachyrhizi]
MIEPTERRAARVRQRTNSIRKFNSLSRSQISDNQNHVNGDDEKDKVFCEVSSVPSSQTSPSPFANPPESIKSTSKGFRDSLLRSSLRIRLEDIQSSSSASSSSGEEDQDQDSEEELWPITKSSSSSNHRSVTGNSILSSSGNQPRSFLVVDHDPVQMWDRRERESSYKVAMRNAIDRRKHFEGIHMRTLRLATEAQERESREKIEELNEILARIGLDKEREMRQMKDGFEKREKERSRLFESMILEAERQEAEESLRLNRIRQEEAALKAEQQRRELEIRQKLEEEKRIRKKKQIAEEQVRLKEKLEREQREKEEEEERERLRKHDGSPTRANYEKWQLTMQKIKEEVLPRVSSDDNFRSICRQAKRRITPKVGQLTNSYSQIQKVIIDLAEVLKETKRAGMEVHLWTCNHLSKALIKQAETEVTAKLNTVYPLGRVVVGLILLGYPELGDVLMARLVKKCYFVSCYKPLMGVGQSDEDYKKQLGFQISASRRDETIVEYSSRMAGLAALYASIIQTDPFDIVPSLRTSNMERDKLYKIPAQFRLDVCWTWISSMMKEPIVSVVTTIEVLINFLSVVGDRMCEVYGKQFYKLIRLILEEGIRKQKVGFQFDTSTKTGIGSRPSIVKLESILEEFLVKYKDKNFKPVEGRLYDNY